MTTAGSSNLDETRQDIEQTRAQLGETVAAMAAKTDVKARLRSKATGTAGGLRQRASHAGQSAKQRVTRARQSAKQRVTQARQSAKQRSTHASQSAKTRVTQLIRTARQTASQRTKPITQKAQQATTAVGDAAKAGARTTSKMESTLVTSARTATTKVGRSVRAKPVPALAATGAAATLALAVYRRRRPGARERKETNMIGKLMFGAGLGLGYVLGTRAGRERFDQISGTAKQVWGSKPVQDAADAVQEQAGHLYEGHKQTTSDPRGGVVWVDEQSHKMQ